MLRAKAWEERKAGSNMILVRSTCCFFRLRHGNNPTHQSRFPLSFSLKKESDWLSLGHKGGALWLTVLVRLHRIEKLQSPQKTSFFQNKGRDAGLAKTRDFYYTAKSSLHLTRGFQRSQTERYGIITSLSAHLWHGSLPSQFYLFPLPYL